MGFHSERAAAGLGPSVFLWLWKGLPWKFVFVLCCSVKLVFFFNSLCAWIVWQWHQSSCLAHLPHSYMSHDTDRLFLLVFVQWFRLECSYMFSGSGCIVLTCSVVQAGLFLRGQWFRLDCSYMFSGSGWIALTCSVVQAGFFLHVQWLRPVPHTSW